MKKVILLFGFYYTAYFSKAQNDATMILIPFIQAKILDLTYSPQQSAFRIWAPTADKAQLLFIQ